MVDPKILRGERILVMGKPATFLEKSYTGACRFINHKGRIDVASFDVVTYPAPNETKSTNSPPKA